VDAFHKVVKAHQLSEKKMIGKAAVAHLFLIRAILCEPGNIKCQCYPWGIPPAC
jgi:hypothetical protein